MKSIAPPVIDHSNFPGYLGQLLEDVTTIKHLLSQQAPAVAPTKPVTTKQLCEYLNITEPTVLRWRAKGAIPFFRIGSAVRYDLPKVIAALESKPKRRG